MILLKIGMCLLLPTMIFGISYMRILENNKEYEIYIKSEDIQNVEAEVLDISESELRYKEYKVIGMLYCYTMKYKVYNKEYKDIFIEEN